MNNKNLPIRFENPIIDQLASSYLRSQNLSEDTELIVCLFAQDAKPIFEGAQFTIKAHCIISQVDDDGMADPMRHAHYDLHIRFTSVLVPCPDSH